MSFYGYTCTSQGRQTPCPRCRGPPGPHSTSQWVYDHISGGYEAIQISGRLSLWTWLPRYREAGIPACQPASAMLCRREGAISILCLFLRDRSPQRSFLHPSAQNQTVAGPRRSSNPASSAKRRTCCSSDTPSSLCLSYIRD